MARVRLPQERFLSAFAAGGEGNVYYTVPKSRSRK